VTVLTRPDTDLPGLTPAHPATGRVPRSWVLASVLGGLTLVATIREGGYWHTESFVIGVACFVILIAEVVLERPEPRALAVIGSLLLLDAFWMVRAITTVPGATFLPLGSSILGFAAAFAAAARLEPKARHVAGQAIAGLGALVALIGFAGLTWRWYPMAIPTQGLWRLSSTLTYSDAAGLVLGVCLLIGLASGPRPWVARLSVCLCAAGLLATQSRGAYVAFAVGCVLVPLRQYRMFFVPLAAGVALGAVAIITSPSKVDVLWLVPATFAAAAVAVAWVPRERRVLSVRVKKAVVVVVAMVAVAIAAGFASHHEIGLRTHSPSDGDRTVEWTAALHQFESSPFVGVGPDRLLQFQAVDGTYAHYAHNEYLQVAADTGIVGLALLGLVGLSLVRGLRRVDVISSCAVAALVCWFVGGAFDFDWHLPLIGLLGGAMAGLAMRRAS